MENVSSSYYTLSDKKRWKQFFSGDSHFWSLNWTSEERQYFYFFCYSVNTCVSLWGWTLAAVLALKQAEQRSITFIPAIVDKVTGDVGKKLLCCKVCKVHTTGQSSHQAPQRSHVKKSHPGGFLHSARGCDCGKRPSSLAFSPMLYLQAWKMWILRLTAHVNCFVVSSDDPP